MINELREYPDSFVRSAADEIERLQGRLAEAEDRADRFEAECRRLEKLHFDAITRWKMGSADSADVSLPEAKPCTCANYCLVKTGGKFLGHVVCRGLPGDDANGHLRLR